MGTTVTLAGGTEQELFLKKLNQMTLEKERAYNDKMMMENELRRLKQNASEATHEAETIKYELNTFRSANHPEIFDSYNDDTSVIADWLEVDMTEGDRLLDALAYVSPSCLPSIKQLKTESSRLRFDDSCLRSYLNYFIHRYDLFNTAWRELTETFRRLEQNVAGIKTEMAAKVKSVEAATGKKSKEMDKVLKEFARVSTLTDVKFVEEHRKFMQMIEDIELETKQKEHHKKEKEKKEKSHRLEQQIEQLNDTHSKVCAQFLAEKWTWGRE